MEGVGAPSLSGGAKLSTIDCIAQSLAVGPIFSAAAIGGALAGLSGGVGPFVVVLTTIGILAIGYVLSELAKRYSGSGAVYELIAHTAGKPAGVFGAAAYYLALAALASALPVIGGITAQGFAAAHLGFDLAWWVWALAILAAMLGVNLVGVQISVKAQLTIIAASAVPFLVLCVVIVAKGGFAGNTAQVFNPAHAADGGGSVFKGILFAILMFVGFEMAAALGEETADPRRSIPTAVLATILIVSAFYLITQYAGTVGSSGTEELPFDFPTLAGHYVGSWLQVLIELAILADIVGIGIGMTAAVSRGVFTLGRDGLLPTWTASVDRRQNPRAGILVLGAVALACVLIGLARYGTGGPLDDAGAPAGPPDALNLFLILATIGSMLFCVVYVVLCVGSVRVFVADNPKGLLAVAIGVLAAGAGFVAQFISGIAPTGDALWGRHIALALVVTLVAWVAVLLATRAERVRAAASFALRHD